MKSVIAFILIASIACFGCRKDSKQNSNQSSSTAKTKDHSHSDNQPSSRPTAPAERSTIKKATKLESLKLQWVSIRVENWPQSFDKKIDYPFKKEAQEAEASIMVQIFSNQFDDSFQQEEIDSLIALNNFARELVFVRQESLPDIISEYAKEPFVTKGDKYVCEIFNSAYYGDRDKQIIKAKDNKNWADLAQSPNPFYRHLALNNYRRVFADSNQWLIFYENFIKDSDPKIITTLVSRVNELGNPKGAELLNKIQEHQKDLLKNNPSLNKKIEESASWLTDLPAK